MAGNFIFVREEGDEFSVVYVGETDNLALHVRERWAEAEQRFGASAIYTRLNISGAQRRQELGELLRMYSPPMNVAAKH
jgi:hypothetical protein